MQALGELAIAMTVGNERPVCRQSGSIRFWRALARPVMRAGRLRDPAISGNAGACRPKAWRRLVPPALSSVIGDMRMDWSRAAARFAHRAGTRFTFTVSCGFVQDRDRF
jgi:hypothetical protein